ncbi:RluA family pseudouridine synthase [Olivibacter sp. SDN3]|uniref:RluA family pseudouridine synthase n=1 Tax=Olivibacter sp. SDN3 TaxID=2764720 RepID=UPI00165163C7|nr:RluA family pseudouridine synthase [Olivibacter sp. SDN3]QNL51749.1 RluA family pseudouridine synthase [Olivibacter sp. SDN3]
MQPIIYQNIIYEDQHLIALNKPANYLVEKVSNDDVPLDELLSQHLSDTYARPMRAQAVHRLDRPVSGALMFAKTEEGLQGMQRLFKYRKIRKTYWAVVRQAPAKEKDKLVHWLTRNREENISTVYNEPCRDGLRAELDYQLLGEVDGYHLIEVFPITGRTHQIRVQLASMGCPIVGDYKYGFPREGSRPSILLHAKELTFDHPIHQEKTTIKAGLPVYHAWRKFESFYQRTSLAMA